MALTAHWRPLPSAPLPAGPPFIPLSEFPQRTSELWRRPWWWGLSMEKTSWFSNKFEVFLQSMGRRLKGLREGVW